MQRLQQIITIFCPMLSNTRPTWDHYWELSETRSPQQGYSTYRLVCEDNGVGISPEFIERVFEPFERAEMNESEVRTGLGMAITRNIARMMDGDICVESTPGRGSRFTVTFNLETEKPDSARFLGPYRAPGPCGG